VKAAKYPAYKPGLSKNIQLLPEHWAELPLKRLFRLEKREPLEGDEIVTAFRDGTVTLRKNRREDGFTNALKEIGYQRINRDDLVIHAMDAFAGAIGVSDSDGKSTPAYSACTATKDASPHFYAYYLRDLALHGFIQSLAKGIRERSTDFRWSDASMVAVPVPPRSEQLAIADFLDRETAKIDALIAEQQRLIELLQEKRQAVISHAVTKGLNPDAPMKDSGVEWLGEVPEHWSVSAVGHRYEVRLGKMLDEKRVTGEYLRPYLRNTDVQWESINVEELPEMDFEPSEHDRYSLREGDLLVCEGGEVGRSAIWQSQLSFCFYQKALHRLRPHNQRSDNSRFQLYVMRMACSMGVFEASAGKATINHLPAESFRRYRFAYPPLDEQIAIGEHLSQVCSQMNELEAEAQSLVSTLQERRSALISAAVTGQIDVRGLVPEMH
jgi:type I restriction enzyme S subunit